MKRLFTTIIIALIFGSAYSQSANDKLLDKLVEKKVITQCEADAIKIEEGEEKNKDGFVKIRDLFNNRYLKLSGYGILKYEYDNEAQGSKSRHDFRPRVVYLTISGEINDYFRYSVLYDFANPRLHELWGELTVNEYFNLKVGQFKNPLSFENQFAPGNLEYSMFSRPTLEMMGHNRDVIASQPGATANSIGRDLGIQVSGTAVKIRGKKFLDYAVGVFQGSGINLKDPDNTKDIAAMLIMYPVKGLRIGGGAHFGEASYNNGISSDPHVRNRYVASAEYTYNRFKVRAEYMRGKDSYLTPSGAYGMAMYDIIPKKVNVLGKVSYFSHDKDSSVEAMDYTIGFNYNIFALTRIQLNYTYSDYTKSWQSILGQVNNHNVTVQIQIGF